MLSIARHRCVITVLIGLATLWLAAASTPASAVQTLRLHGSNTIGEALAPGWIAAWMTSRGCTGVMREILVPGQLLFSGTGDCDLAVDLQTHGSSTGLADLFDGKADLAMASRPVNDREHARGLDTGLGDLRHPTQELVVALDGVAVIVHPDNPLRELRVAQVRQLFSGEVRDWSGVGGRAGAVRVFARDDASGTFDTFRTLVLGERRLRGDAARLESTQELAEAVANDPLAIGFAGFADIGATRALAISDAGVAMSPEGSRIAVEDYALSRRLFLYRAQETTPLAEDFEAFVTSAEGQALAERHGFVSQEVRAYADSLRRDAPASYRALVGDAQRLSLNFRFAPGRVDTKAARDVQRLAEFMARPENQGRHLVLLGFADPDEVAPLLAQMLSNDRVDAIVDRLSASGVAVSRARGIGGAAPLAADSGEAGRQRNRRVEVWIQPPPAS